ncbi:MAG: peptidase domain protein [Gammaproteobacteria bacterium]|jgi:zinc protease|nr:peptidase domain protein [Gammaproteobacteria bacterium]
MFDFSIKSLRAGVCSLLLFLNCSAFAQTTFQQKTLANGLTIYVKEDHRAPVLITEVWYKVGSSYESTGDTGISHLLEHMMFKGTPKHGLGEFSRLIAENGGQENAFTYDDFTAYYQELAADKLPLSFELESDRMRHLNLNAADFNEEVKVVREERRWRTDNDPQGKMTEQFLSQAYVALPYHNPTVGWPADLQNITVEDLRAWYQRWYAPNNAFIVVVGDVKANDVFNLAEKYFGPLKPMVVPLTKPQQELANPGSRRIHLKIPAQVPMLMMGYNIPTVISAKNSIDPYALDVLNNILAGGDSARLPKNLVRKLELASSIGINYELYKRFSSVFVIETVPQEGVSPETLEKAIRAQIKIVQQKPVSAEELARVKRNVIANNIYQQDSIDSLAETVGILTAVGRDWREIDNYVAQVQKVTPQDVQRVAQQYLVPAQETVGVLTPLPSNTNGAAPSSNGESYVR